MARYKISELAQLWGCSVPTVHKRVEKEGYETIQALDEQNKMVKYVVIDDIENDVNNVVNVNENVVNYEKENIQAEKFINALMILTKEHEKILEQKNNELADYKITNALLEDKNAREGILIDENRTLKQEKRKIKQINEYFKIAIALLLIIIFSLTVYVCTVNKMISKEPTQVENVENPTK